VVPSLYMLMAKEHAAEPKAPADSASL